MRAYDSSTSLLSHGKSVMEIKHLFKVSGIFMSYVEVSWIENNLGL